MTQREDWQRAREAVESRMSELRMDRSGLADAAKVDRKTVDNFLDHGRKPQMPSRGGYEKALGWAWGSLTKVARGGAPTPVDPQPTVSVPDAIDADPALSEEDGRALKRHYFGLVQFAQQRREFERQAAGKSPPDPPKGRDGTGPSPTPTPTDPHLDRDPPVPSLPHAMPEPANDH